MKLVGIGTRTLNFIIDILCISLIAYILFQVNNWYVFYWHHTHYNFAWFFYPVLVIYYLVFESIFSRTPGKWLTITKVVTKTGKRPSFLQVLLRSFTRLILIEFLLIPFYNKTLHDIISGTEVVES